MESWDVPDGVSKKVLYGGKENLQPMPDGAKVRHDFSWG